MFLYFVQLTGPRKMYGSVCIAVFAMADNDLSNVNILMLMDILIQADCSNDKTLLSIVEH